MTPFFTPEPTPYGPARIFLAGVGAGMTEVAGEVADGFLVHPFSTAEFLREHTLPALDRGLATAGRSRDDFEISWPAMVVTGATEADIVAASIGHPGPARVLRLDPRVQGRARRPRLG